MSHNLAAYESEPNPVIGAVLFDFDGTLTQPQSLDLVSLRRTLGCPEQQTILEYIADLPSPQKEEALSVLDHYEFEAATTSLPNCGAEDLVCHLRSLQLPLGIVSRNRHRSIVKALGNFEVVETSDFGVIISRDDGIEVKPDPAGIVIAARKLGLDPSHVLVVGDYVFDIEAGQRAGARTAYLTNRSSAPPLSPPPDFAVQRLGEVKDIVRFLRPLPAGKLPNDLLGIFLKELPLDDPSVLLKPGVGEDVAAVVAEKGNEVIVLKTDPITFATEQLGYYTVIVNANDMATCGAVPRWLLTTLLLPVESNGAQIYRIMKELHHAAAQHGLSLCGGHTEITDAVTKPIVVGQLVGTVSREELIDKRRMSQGDKILISKAVALEGTSLIAREFPEQLHNLGISEAEIERCQQLLFDPGISVLAEAGLAAAWQGVTAMHDVTEGGLATALSEFSTAGGHRMKVDVGQIPILPETLKLSAALELKPLGLIASGSLLITCSSSNYRSLMEAIAAAGIQISCIGEVLEPGCGISAVSADGVETNWPRFETDEIVRASRKLGDGS